MPADPYPHPTRPDPTRPDPTPPHPSHPSQIEGEEAGPNADEAFVTFTVTTRPNAPGSQGRPADTQRERSHFKREGGRWLYFDFK
jgi:uncharacterized protein YchJ